MIEMDDYSGRYAGGDDQVYELGQVHDSIGGQARRTLALQRSWFDAAAMLSEDAVDLDEMTINQLKAELEARDESKTGRKPELQRRLRALIVDARMREQDEEEGELAGEEGGEEGEEGEDGGD